MLAALRQVTAKLKTKGALSFRLADEEAALSAKASENTQERAAEQKATAAEAPKLQAALAAVRPDLAAYQFSNAVAALEKVQLDSRSLQAERDSEIKRAQWLASWKTALVADINNVGFGGAVTDIHGVRCDGPVRRATATEMELKTRYWRVMTRWLNLSPQMLLTMSTAFIRPGVSDIPERELRCAIFAAETGQKGAALELARKAAEGKTEFRDFLPYFFPDAKK